MVEVTYVEAPEPIKVGEYRGDDLLAFGAYRVQIGDFVYLTSHTGFRGTVSEEPISLEANPDFRTQLITDAERARSSAT